ncbi:MAG: hypothetical protein PHD97_09900 [Bacteroidales bacterium]|nr:hypothetical protein [Bacteroidales bacterium]
MEENKNTREIDLIEILAFMVDRIKKRKIFIVVFVILVCAFGAYKTSKMTDTYQVRSLCHKNLIGNDLMVSMVFSFQDNIIYGQSDDLAKALNLPVNAVSGLNLIKADTFRNSDYVILKVMGSDLNSLKIVKNAVYVYFNDALKNEIDLRIKQDKYFLSEIQKSISEINNIRKLKNTEINIDDKGKINQPSLLNEYFELNKKKSEIEKEIQNLEKDGVASEVRCSDKTIPHAGFIRTLLKYFIVSVLMGCFIVIALDLIILIDKKLKEVLKK